MTDTPIALKQTPLHATHLGHKARMVPFGGWDMPVEYSGITDEHMAVRTRAGLFDVSHMGEIEIAGADALAAVQKISSNDASRLAIGQIHYSALTTPEGTFVDDLLVYRMADDHFLLVVNASNIEKDYAWIRSQVQEFADAPAVNASNRYALLALQGPAAVEVLQSLTAVPLDEMKYYWFAHRRGGRRARHDLAHRVHGRGRVRGLRAAGAGRARVAMPSCRLARAPASFRPASARATRCGSRRRCGCSATTWTRPRPCSRRALAGSSAGRRRPSTAPTCSAPQKADGLTRTLVGFEMVDRAIARHGYPVVVDGQTVGIVTSGTQTPFLKKAIGMAYVPTALAEPDRRDPRRGARPSRRRTHRPHAVLQAAEELTRRCIPPN